MSPVSSPNSWRRSILPLMRMAGGAARRQVEIRRPAVDYDLEQLVDRERQVLVIERRRRSRRGFVRHGGDRGTALREHVGSLIASTRWSYRHDRRVPLARSTRGRDEPGPTAGTGGSGARHGRERRRAAEARRARVHARVATVDACPCPRMGAQPPAGTHRPARRPVRSRGGQSGPDHPSGAAKSLNRASPPGVRLTRKGAGRGRHGADTDGEADAQQGGDMIARLRNRIAGNREGGFTLIELLVVLIIIAVLLAIAIPSYLGLQGSRREARRPVERPRVGPDR